MAWLGERRGDLIDWLTQRWVKLTGKRIALIDAPWLTGPVGAVTGIGADFFARWGPQNGLRVLPPSPDDGLLRTLGELAGPTFRPSDVHEAISDFYEHTAAYDLRIEIRWCGAFRAIGWLISRIFSRRLRQLNIPLSNRELANGIDSRIIRLANAQGHVESTWWIRTMAGSEQPMFVAQYGVATIPGHAGPCIKVVFPLPNGNAIILLKPVNDPDKGLSLISEGKNFGDPGFYFTVIDDANNAWVRRVHSMKEQLRVDLQNSGIVGNHRFFIFGIQFLELYYTIAKRPFGLHRGSTSDIPQARH